MHLTDFLHVDDFSVEAATFAPEFRCGRRCCNNRALLYNHRNDKRLAIDDYVRRNAVRNMKIRNGVLAELIELFLTSLVVMPETF